MSKPNAGTRRTDLIHLTNVEGIDRNSWAVIIRDNTQTVQFQNSVIITFN